MRFFWTQEPAPCNGCQLAALVENGEWGTSVSGQLHQSAERVQFNYLTVNTWEGQYFGAVPKDISMTVLTR